MNTINENDVLKTLAVRAIPFCHFSGIPEWGGRTTIVFEDGTIKSGYLAYDVDFGGYFMFYSHKTITLSRKNVFVVDPSKIVSICPARQDIAATKEEFFMRRLAA